MMKFALALMFVMLAGCRSGPAQGEPVRVMSLNLRYDNPADGVNRWSERRDLLVDVVRAFHPDLLGTQECLASQAAFLREALPEYAFIGAGRDDGKLKGEMTALFFRADRFELLDSGHFWLSKTPDVPGSKSWDAAITRMVSWVNLRDRRDDTTIWCFNTHFDHRGEQAREMSSQLLRERVLEMSGGQRVVITGDFNASAEGRVSSLLRGSVDDGPTLVDTYRAVHPLVERGEGTFDDFKGVDTGDRIDWIVVTPDVRVIDAGIDRTHVGDHWPSDHFPVTAVVRLAGGE